MLRHVRDHVQDCDSFGKDRDCPSKSKKKYPFRAEGRHEGIGWHQSLRTNDEKTVIRLVGRIVETGLLEFDRTETKSVGVLDAVEGFLAEETARGSAQSTLKSFRKLLVGSVCGRG
jgi:hypothetical protein